MKKWKNKWFPSSLPQILKLSQRYQRVCCFEHEKELIEHGLGLFPESERLLERAEWLARPVFHPDVSKSQVQPRKIIHKPRELEWTPKQSTMDSLCIVTGISSNEPYFELGFQLIESIKATQHYANIPIKVLDCGLSQEHREILKSYFDLEIKDPAWDIEPSLITSSPHFIKFENLSSWKGCTARPYLAKHFPGYGYYLWIDADTWINDEQILDKLIVFAENQEIGCLSESKPVSRSIIRRSLTREQLCRFGKETLIINGLFCLSRGAIDEYAAHAGQQIDLLGRYGWGFDMAVFNLMFYEKYSTAKTLLFTGIDSDLVGPLSVYILYGRYKHLGYMHISSGRLLLKMQIIFRAWGRMYEGLLLMTNRLSGAVPVSYRFREFHTQSPGQPSL